MEGFFGYDGTHILGKDHNNSGHLIIKHKWTTKDDICVGPIWNMKSTKDPNQRLMSMNLFQCQEIPCNGRIPCIR